MIRLSANPAIFTFSLQTFLDRTSAMKHEVIFFLNWLFNFYIQGGSRPTFLHVSFQDTEITWSEWMFLLVILFHLSYWVLSVQVLTSVKYKMILYHNLFFRRMWRSDPHKSRLKHPYRSLKGYSCLISIGNSWACLLNIIYWRETGNSLIVVLTVWGPRIRANKTYRTCPTHEVVLE